MNATVVHQNEELLILNKMNDVSFHSENKSTGLFAETEAQYNQKLWPLHRLDKVTSGLLMIARNKSTAALISNLFENKEIQKVYLAISNKKPKKKQGLIIGDMEKARNGSWKLSYSKNNPAITRFYSSAIGDGKRLYWLLPQTGKTHQLRVAMKSIGAPILGDSRYGGDTTDRCYLHAYRTRFKLNGATYKFQCLPECGAEFKTSAFFESLDSLQQKCENSI